MSSFSGLICSLNATFTCEARSESPLVIFFVNNQSLYRFEYSQEIVYPYNDIESGFSIHVDYANVSNTIFNIFGFTLSFNLDDLYRYIGSFISCGTLAKESDRIEVINFTKAG